MYVSCLLCVRVAIQVAEELSEERRHTFAVLSLLPIARRGADGWKANDKTKKCPVRVATQVAEELSEERRHNFAVESLLPVARRGAVG